MTRVDYGRDKGLMGDKCLVKNLQFSSAGASTTSEGLFESGIFVKMFPSDPSVPAQFAANLFRTEKAFLTLANNKDGNAAAATSQNDDATPTTLACGVDEKQELQKLRFPGFRTPKCYFLGGTDSDVDNTVVEEVENDRAEATPTPGADRPRFVFFMEPVGTTSSCISILDGLSVDQCISAASDLAGLHAPCFGWTRAAFKACPELASFAHLQDDGKVDSMKTFLLGASKGYGKSVREMVAPATDEGSLPAEALMRQIVPNVLKYFDYVEAEMLPVIEEKFSVIAARWTSMPHSIWHGDFTCENVLWAEEGRSTSKANTYIDFQLTQLQPGIRDLCMLVASSCRVPDREAPGAEERIVAAYHEALMLKLQEREVDYSFQQCWDDYVFLKFAVMFPATAVGGFVKHNLAKRLSYFAAGTGEPHKNSDADVEAGKKVNQFFGNILSDLQKHNMKKVLGGGDAS
eukprot:g16508.t1